MDITQRVADFMMRRPAASRLYRRRDLNGLGDFAQVDAALETLARQGLVGSPGPDLWFPLRSLTTSQGAIQVPPAPLRVLAQDLLAREGVPLVASPQEKTYSDYSQYDNREGAWGVPNFEDIGVGRPESLVLEWAGQRVHTVWDEEVQLPEQPPVCNATHINDPEGFRRLAESLYVIPERLEKDICVNTAITALPAMILPPHGLLLFAGGTSLTKAWRLTSRYSEDIDLRFQGYDSLTIVPEAVKRAVHTHFKGALVHHLIPHLSGGRLREEDSAYVPLAPVQRVWVEYDSLYVTTRGRIKFEVMFTPGLVPWDARPVTAFPAATVWEDTLVKLPCVPTWVTMTEKLHAVANMSLDGPVEDMRHVVDLGAWLQRENRNLYSPFMVRLALQDGILPHLLDGLWDNLGRLENHPSTASRYDQYVHHMFPRTRSGEAPPWQQIFADIRSIWQSMCHSQWEQLNWSAYIPPTPHRQSDLDALLAETVTTPPELKLDKRFLDSPGSGQAW